MYICLIVPQITIVCIHTFSFLYMGFVNDISSNLRNTGTFEAGADHEQAVVVHAGFDISSRKALSILKSSAAMWLHV